MERPRIPRSLPLLRHEAAPGRRFGLRFVLLALAALWPARAAAQPDSVTVGMHVVDLGEFNLKTGSYTADFYVWVRWQGRREPAFEVMNGSGEECPLGFRRQVGAVRYAVYRCRYVFHKGFDLSGYPLDHHELTVELEDKEFTDEEMVYVPDRASSALDRYVALPGWQVGRPRMYVRDHVYTALGDPVRPPGSLTTYTRLVLAVPVQRAGAAIFLKSFLVLFLSVGVGLLCSALQAQHVEARLGVGVASIFGVVSSYLVVAQALPESAQFTLADKLHLVGMASVFLSIVISVAVYRVSGRMGEERVERLDRWLGWATTVGFAAAVVAITALR